MIKKLAEKNSGYLYFVFRILIGLLFFWYGWMKLQGGVFSGPSLLLVIAAIVELIAGPLIIFGLFTRTAALFGAIQMVGADFIVHIPQGVNPLTNSGQPAILFFAAFLVLLGFGARKWAIDK